MSFPNKLTQLRSFRITLARAFVHSLDRDRDVKNLYARAFLAVNSKVNKVETFLIVNSRMHRMGKGIMASRYVVG